MQQMQSDVMNRAELIQTCCVACQISSPVCSEGSLPGCKAAEAWGLSCISNSAEVMNVWSYISTPPISLHDVVLG